jgi:hypothetical protein
MKNGGGIIAMINIRTWNSPTEMTNSVCRAIQRREEEKRMMFCSAAKSAAVYPEVFEL